MAFKPPKIGLPWGRKQSNKVYAVKCQEDSRDLYIKETKQPPAKQMAQRRRTNSSGQDLAVYLYLQASGHSFNHEDVQILHREECWFKQRVKEAICVKMEQPCLNQEEGTWGDV